MSYNELASRIYLQTEQDKALRGIERTYQKVPKIFSLAKEWTKKDLPITKLKSLQSWVSLEIVCGTNLLFKNLGSANLETISKNIENLRQLNSPPLNNWLDGVTPDLSRLTLAGQVQPLILVQPACLIQGNMLDGNHRALSVLTYDQNSDSTVHSLIGRIDPFVWSLYFAKSLASHRNAQTMCPKDCVTLALERLKNLNQNI